MKSKILFFIRRFLNDKEEGVDQLIINIVDSLEIIRNYKENLVTQ